jgi:hypothetical protein
VTAGRFLTGGESYCREYSVLERRERGSGRFCFADCLGEGALELSTRNDIILQNYHNFGMIRQDKTKFVFRRCYDDFPSRFNSPKKYFSKCVR